MEITSGLVRSFLDFAECHGSLEDLATARRISAVARQNPKINAFLSEIITLTETTPCAMIASWLRNGRAFAALQATAPTNEPIDGQVGDGTSAKPAKMKKVA